MFLVPTRRSVLNRDVLNRRDRRLTGRTTWFPLTTHRRSMGDVSGEIATQSGVVFDPDQATGVRLRIEGNRNCTTGLTASTLGISGSGTPWSIFFAYAHWSNLGASSAYLFTLGDNGNGNNIECNCRNDGVRIGNWAQYVSVDPGLGSATKTVFVAITWDGDKFHLDLRAWDPATLAWGPILGASSASTTCNLSDAKALRFADNTAGAGGHGAWTGIGFWGLVARRPWSRAERVDWLLNPTALWSPGRRWLPMEALAGGPDPAQGQIVVTLPIGATGAGAAAASGQAAVTVPMGATGAAAAAASGQAAVTLAIGGASVSTGVQAGQGAAAIPLAASAAATAGAQAQAAALLPIGAAGATQAAQAGQGAASVPLSASAVGAGTVLAQGAATLPVGASGAGAQGEVTTAAAAAAIPITVAASGSARGVAEAAIGLPLAVIAGGQAGKAQGSAAVLLPIGAGAAAFTGAPEQLLDVIAELALRRPVAPRLALARPIEAAIAATRPLVMTLDLGGQG